MKLIYEEKHDDELVEMWIDGNSVYKRIETTVKIGGHEERVNLWVKNGSWVYCEEPDGRGKVYPPFVNATETTTAYPEAAELWYEEQDK